MRGFAIVFGLALLPALGNFSGGLVAEYLPTSKRNLNRALHAASGIVIAIVAVELVPRALEATSGWIVAAAFGVGGLAYVALEALVERLQKKRSDGDDRTGMWVIYIAVAVDLFSDGLMIGAGSAVATSLALGLALGQVLADVPEGFATIANFKDKDVPDRDRTRACGDARCHRCARSKRAARPRRSRRGREDRQGHRPRAACLRCGVRDAENGMLRLRHDLGLSGQKARPVPPEADPKAQARFKQNSRR